jgi:hypothetical protein
LKKRTPADFSREFAGYMATSAERFIERYATDPEAHDDYARRDALRDLRSAIYEWRKREHRAAGRVSPFTRLVSLWRERIKPALLELGQA